MRVWSLGAGIAKAALAAAFACATAHAALPVQPTTTAAGRWHDASIGEYRNHLVALTSLVEDCAKARDLKNCDPTLVGPDDRVPLGNPANAERRLVRYGWLRVLFSKAEEADETPPKPAADRGKSSREALGLLPRPSTSQLLQDAKKRLARDLAQTEGMLETPTTHAEVRDTMKLVLAGREFRNLTQPSVSDTMMEKLGNWLNHLFEKAARFKARSAWVGRVIVWGFVLVVCVGLVWGLLQIERRWRVRLISDSERPVSEAASARDWQLWLEDARRAAAAGLWREAIHFVYWASISRLESRRLWPADRARTPREYLALVGPEDPRKAGLAQLTGSFERTWYGGRPAGESDYLKAESLATALISGVAAPAELSAVTEGGAG